MIRLVVADTSALVALGNKRDNAHKRAADFMERVAEEDAILIVSDYVLDETFTMLMRRGLDLNVIERLYGLVESSIENGALKLSMMNQHSFDRAWLAFKKFFEHGASFTDCVVYEIAKDINADCIFAFDDHFAKMGSRVMP